MGKKGSFHPAFCNAVDVGKLWLIAAEGKEAIIYVEENDWGPSASSSTAGRVHQLQMALAGRKEEWMDGWCGLWMDWCGCGLWNGVGDGVGDAPVVVAAAVDSLPSPIHQLPTSKFPPSLQMIHIGHLPTSRYTWHGCAFVHRC
jgi:hypothetical protein